MKFKTLRNKKTKKFGVIGFETGETNMADVRLGDGQTPKILDIPIPSLYPLHVTESEIKASFMDGFENAVELSIQLDKEYELVTMEVCEPSNCFTSKDVYDFARFYLQEKTNGNNKIASKILNDWIFEGKPEI